MSDETTSGLTVPLTEKERRYARRLKRLYPGEPMAFYERAIQGRKLRLALAATLGERQDRTANRIRSRLEEGSDQEAMEATGALFGEHGSTWLTIAPALDEVETLLTEFADRLGRSDLLTNTDVDRYEAALKDVDRIRELSRLLDERSPALRSSLGRCKQCGGKRLQRGRSPYCSDSCKETSQKMRQRAAGTQRPTRTRTRSATKTPRDPSR